MLQKRVLKSLLKEALVKKSFCYLNPPYISFQVNKYCTYYMGVRGFMHPAHELWTYKDPGNNQGEKIDLGFFNFLRFAFS